MERVFLRPGAVTRWPLYLRQAKAVLRAGDEGFDERKYGFAGLVEALRFGQREGLFRLDRDRQGVLRVYPGQLLQRAEGGGAMAGRGRRAGVSRADAAERRRRRAGRRADATSSEPIEDTRAFTAARQSERTRRRRRRRQRSRPSVAPVPRRSRRQRRRGRAQGAAAAKAACRRRSAPPRRPPSLRRFAPSVGGLPEHLREHSGSCSGRSPEGRLSGSGSRSTTVASSYFTVTGADIVTGTTWRRSSSL